MTKADLIDLIAERAKLPHGRAELLICQMFDSMVDALCRGEGIEIRGFGSFSIRAYKEYQGRNPRTGEAVRVRPKRLAFFKVGKELRERVNAQAGTNGVNVNVNVNVNVSDDGDDGDDDEDAPDEAETT